MGGCAGWLTFVDVEPGKWRRRCASGCVRKGADNVQVSSSNSSGGGMLGVGGCQSMVEGRVRERERERVGSGAGR